MRVQKIGTSTNQSSTNRNQKQNQTGFGMKMLLPDEGAAILKNLKPNELDEIKKSFNKTPAEWLKGVIEGINNSMEELVDNVWREMRAFCKDLPEKPPGIKNYNEIEVMSVISRPEEPDKTFLVGLRNPKKKLLENNGLYILITHPQRDQLSY